MDATLEALMSLGNGVTVAYVTDDLGAPTAIKNWEEIAQLMQESLNLMLDFLNEAGMSEPELQQVHSSVAPMFSTREQVENFASEQIQLYHLVYGWGSLEVEKLLIYDALLPNPFGGDPFPSIGQIELVDVDSDSGQALVAWSQTFDPDAARQVLLDSMTDLALSTGSEPPTESDLPDPFAIEDQAQIEFDMGTGWVQKMVYSRTITIGPTMREEITEIVDMTDE
jgi:hypothetical protein